MKSRSKIYMRYILPGGIMTLFSWLIIYMDLTLLLHEFVSLILLSLMFVIVRRTFMKAGKPALASGAIVMSTGIFLSGVIHRFPYIDVAFGKLAALILLTIWLFITISYFRCVKLPGFHHPVQSFAVGTWIAGTSVCGSVLHQRLPELDFLAIGMAVINGAVWLFFLILCIKNFKKVFSTRLFREVHGVVLLSTVSTQSIVIFYSTMFGQVLSPWMLKGLITTGILFYLIGFFMVLRRYFPTGRWNLCEDWNNTNCILHGAMSITGLAATLSQSLPNEAIAAIWVSALVLFVIVEGIECFRAGQRIRKYGFVKGIGTYHVSQWSRNFTFGMFFAFTMNLPQPLKESFLPSVQTFIIQYGAWVILALFVNEFLLYLKEGNKWNDPRAVQQPSSMSG